MDLVFVDPKYTKAYLVSLLKNYKNSLIARK